MKPIPDYGDLMTLEEFIQHVENGYFIDYDGQGEYATDTHVTGITVIPSDIIKGNINEEYTHVVWYNR